MGGQHAGGHGPVQLSPRPSHLTESLTHAANDWTNPDNPHVRGLQLLQLHLGPWHLVNLDHVIIGTTPKKRQPLFRGTWAPGGNRAYSADNRRRETCSQ